MLYYAGIGLGLSLIFGSAYKMFDIMKKSVIITKKDFIKIEEKIRQNEREKVLEECQLKKK